MRRTVEVRFCGTGIGHRGTTLRYESSHRAHLVEWMTSLKRVEFDGLNDWRKRPYRSREGKIEKNTVSNTTITN